MIRHRQGVWQVIGALIAFAWFAVAIGAALIIHAPSVTDRQLAGVLAAVSFVSVSAAAALHQAMARM